MKDEVVQEILSEGRIYEVGGCVRDAFLKSGFESKDRDYLVCDISLPRLQQILRRHGRVDTVGRSFGVIKFTLSDRRDRNSLTYDISLPRSEKSTGVGHTDFEVDFDPSLPIEDDLIRRDFTINAMARDLRNGELIDPYGGRADLDKRLIRMVSPVSFEEDPLRMLRAVQFAARFEFDIEPDTYRALVENVELINSVSPERIAEELNKLLLRAARPSIGLRLMQKSGLMKQIIPEMEPAVGCEQPGGYHAYDVFEHTVRMVDACRPGLAIRLAALFHDITKPQHKRLTENGATFYSHELTGAKVAEEVMSRLKYSRELIKDVKLLIERHMFTTEVGPKGLRRFIRRIGQRMIPDLLDLRRADVIAQGMGGTTEDVDLLEKAIADEISRKPPFGRSDLALGGRDIIRIFKLGESPLIGDILDYLMEKVLDNPDDNDPEILEDYVRRFLENKSNRENRNT